MNPIQLPPTTADEAAVRQNGHINQGIVFKAPLVINPITNTPTLKLTRIRTAPKNRSPALTGDVIGSPCTRKKFIEKLI